MLLHVPSHAVPSPSALPPLDGFYPLKKVPDRLPLRANGKRLHPKIPHRWALQGCHGVRLRFLAAGRQKLVCDAWLFEFLAAVAAAQQAGRHVATAQVPPPKPALQRGRSAARTQRTDRLLSEVGLGRGGRAK